MPDREKVMTWLEICGKNNDCSGCCPYSENGLGEYGQCRESLMADAYELLKEQEPIQVTGTRGSGKTTKLLNLAAENGYVIVEPNARMADYVRHIATEKGLNVNVISSRELLYRQRGVVREKYLVDELKMFMASLGIVGYSDEAVII